MRLIDADAMMSDTLQEYENSNQYRNAIIRMINKAPTIDAVEVVRCKDCKWRKACKVFSQQQITDDSYCSWGEREGE